MTRSSRSLEQVRARHPRYQIDRDARRDPPRYIAATRDLTLSPSALISTDLAEVDELLTAAAPPLTDHATRATAELSADWPRWQIWTVPRVCGGTLYCARRWEWKPGDIVLNASGPEELAGYLEDQAQPDNGT